MEQTANEKKYWGLFEISLIVKGINAIFDLVGGIVIWYTSKIVLVTTLLNFFQGELSDNPKDYIGNFIVDSAASLAVSSQYVVGGYLFIHGIVKIFLLICLYKKKLWAYPTSIIIFTLLIFYEGYSLFFTYTLWTLIFTIFDIILVLLTVREYRILKNK